METNLSSLDAGVRAALETGKAAVCVTPPASWSLLPVFSGLRPLDQAGTRLLVLVPSVGDGFEAARMLRQVPGSEPVHVSAGAPRTGRLLSAGAVRTLVATPTDAFRLLRQSALPLARLPAIAVLWPEFILAGGEGATLDTVLGEAGSAQRIVAVTTERSAADFLERHARRAPRAILARIPEEPVRGVGYAVVGEDSRPPAVRGVLDATDPATTLIWEPSPDRLERWAEWGEDPTVAIAGAAPADRRFSLALAADLPTAEILAQLAASADQVVVLVRGSQLPYLQQLARPLRAIRVPGALDRERERSSALRRGVRERLERGEVDAELLALAPLFDEYDPALVAAALARPLTAGPAAPEATAWVRIQLNVGKRDHVRPADVLGAILNGVGLPKDHVGRIDIKDGLSTVEIRLEDLKQALAALPGLAIRGRPIAARVL